ncbi:MAG: uroporphyrinogen decarboxylase family protein [Promethearchaeota archaeon]
MATSNGICPIIPVTGPFTIVLEGMGWVSFAKHCRRNPALVEKFAERVTDKVEEYLKTVLKDSPVKIVCVSDDLAMKGNVMLTPSTMESIFFQFFRQIVDVTHRYHGRIFLHSDGFIEPLLEYIIEAGFDGVQCLESAAGVNIYRVKKEWGDKLCLIGNVDCNRDLFYMKPGEMREHTRNMVETLKEGGGYIFGPSSTIYGSMPLENVLAMIDGWRDGRDY